MGCFLDALPTVNNLIERGIEAGEHLGAQVYLSLDGKVVADAACGEVRPGVAMTGDSIQTWMSATKPVTAVAFAQQWELGRFYEMLLNGGELNGTRIIEPETVEVFTDRHRVGMHDHSFKHVIDWGLGFIPNSARHGVDTVPYGYGPHASEQTYGHSGYQSSVAFADPAHGLTAAIVFNGMPGDAAHHKRIYSLLDALYTDLGLV